MNKINLKQIVQVWYFRKAFSHMVLVALCGYPLKSEDFNHAYDNLNHLHKWQKKNKKTQVQYQPWIHARSWKHFMGTSMQDHHTKCMHTVSGMIVTCYYHSGKTELNNWDKKAQDVHLSRYNFLRDRMNIQRARFTGFNTPALEHTHFPSMR